MGETSGVDSHFHYLLLLGHVDLVLGLRGHGVKCSVAEGDPASCCAQIDVVVQDAPCAEEEEEEYAPTQVAQDAPTEVAQDAPTEVEVDKEEEAEEDAQWVWQTKRWMEEVAQSAHAPSAPPPPAEETFLEEEEVDKEEEAAEVPRPGWLHTMDE